ncbi:SH3 domain-containing protein [Clostridium sp. AWRP]|uniref:SH3 domain-containing protein n=1 Tax=Clostridium sp. AWRP TaxID=2212991 RepID=UPI000FDCA6B1|nr:SH3 domain-containing protein [Clostridium sp. AWRP]AZV56726.1 SH3 domain-containing protein [Clostridium sp. AWRP]
MKKSLAKILVPLIAFTSVMSVPFYKVSAAAQTPISRTQVEQRATSLVDLTWTYSANRNSNISSQYSSSVTLPNQFKGVTTATFKGIPYAWGGIDGINTTSYNAPWTSFLDAVNKGAFTGNVNTGGGLGYIPGTAGMDCSGFVQASFNIADYKQSTSTLLNNYFKKIDLNSLQHMDILDKPGDHVVIFDKWGTLNGVQGAFTYESTPDQTYGGIQGAKRYFISMNTINQGYIPARYINIVEDASSQTTGTTTQSSTFKIGGYAQVANVTSYANLRTNPSTSYAILTTVPKGTILKLTDYSNGWYQVTYNGQTGWIWGNILGAAPVNQNNTTSDTSSNLKFKVGGYAQVANVTNYVNLRTNPSTSYSILTTIPKGTILKLADYSNGWYQVTYNGQTGWMWGNILGAVPTNQYITISGAYQLNIRSNSSSTAQIIGVLSQGQYAQKIGQTSDGSWYKISINGIEGWSSSKYLTYIQ